MKGKLTALVLAAVLLAGCTAPADPDASASQSGTSQSETSAQEGKSNVQVQTDWSVLEGEEPLETVFQRWYPDYVDTLRPREDYGLLLPFAGAKAVLQPVEEEWEYVSSANLYGLMTQEGTVVLDAVCSSIYRVSYTNEAADSVFLPILALEKGDKERGDPIGGTLLALAAADGSWSTEFLYWGCAASPTALLAGNREGLFLLAPETGEVVKQWNWGELGIDSPDQVPWFTGDAYSTVQWADGRFFLGCYGAQSEEARFLDPMTGEVSTTSAQAWYSSVDARYQDAGQTWWDAAANGDGTYTLTMGEESHRIASPVDMGDMLPYVAGGDRVVFDDGHGKFAVTDLEGSEILPPREGTLSVLQSSWEEGGTWLAVRLTGEELWLIYDWNGTLSASVPGDAGSWCSTIGSLVEVRSENMAAYYRPEDGTCVLRVWFGLPGENSGGNM